MRKREAFSKRDGSQSQSASTRCTRSVWHDRLTAPTSHPQDRDPMKQFRPGCPGGLLSSTLSLIFFEELSEFIEKHSCERGAIYISDNGYA
ncbi:hypothetical protein Memar_0754 [Methanoculleus marisnigri JR1]|uniref:Uncharacterized protein n=1 Tax=Methanoculleus marisnigri (strain ATCC 35101 / DSM 1498 / JR1) TaxID=368407 RepID=A3CTI7_METMJ|nr:hypothetical protein Memar_0754 [Methanoculleus marisnigri JR1]